MKVVLLEKITKLGDIGSVVNVKDGFARNYLLPLQKAARATKDNIADIEARRAELQKQYEAQIAESQSKVSLFDNLSVNIIRQASEDGKLFGSVTSKEIANEITSAVEMKVTGNMLSLNGKIREVGLYDVEISLHPEVTAKVLVNVARTEEEAKAALLPSEKEEAQTADETKAAE